MKKITDKQYEEYQQYLHDKATGRILTPDGLALIVKACDFDPLRIGVDMLNNYCKICLNKK